MRSYFVVVACALLGACDQPKWLDPASSHGSAALAPALARMLDEQDLKAPPHSKPAEGATKDAPPPPPAWATNLIGQPLRTLFPTQTSCIATPDFVQLRFLGGRGGVRIVGWGWDPTAKTPVPRILVVDSRFRIVGVGESGVRRLDVPKVRQDVTSEFSGWSAITSRTSGPVAIFGLLADGKTICRGGRLEL